MDMKAKVDAIVKKLNDSTSFQYRMFVIVFCIVMLLFCTSKFYLPSISNITPTPYQTQQKASSSTTLTLCSFQYNPVSGYMELVASIENESDNFHLHFDVSAVTSSDRTRKLDSEIKYSSQQILVVGIHQIKKFDGVKISIIEETEVASGSKSSGAEFICTKDSVEKNSSLDVKSQNQYQQMDMQISIQNIDREIQEIQDEIQKTQTEIDGIQKDIAVLEQQKQYQTEEEIKTTSNAQTSKQMQINRLNTDIVNHQKKQETLKQKQEKYKNQLTNLQQTQA